MIAPVKPPASRIRTAPSYDEAIREQYVEPSSVQARVNEVASGLQHSMTDFVNRHPVAAVATAAVIGLSLGFALKRRS